MAAHMEGHAQVFDHVATPQHIGSYSTPSTLGIPLSLLSGFLPESSSIPVERLFVFTQPSHHRCHSLSPLFFSFFSFFFFSSLLSFLKVEGFLFLMRGSEQVRKMQSANNIQAFAVAAIGQTHDTVFGSPSQALGPASFVSTTVSTAPT